MPPRAVPCKSYKPRDHPWKKLIEPGPWAKLPLAPPPVLPTHPTSIPSLNQLWLRHWATPSNPFEEEEENEGPKDKQGSSHSWSDVNQLVNVASASSNAKSIDYGVADSQVSDAFKLVNDSRASVSDGGVDELSKLEEHANSNVFNMSSLDVLFRTDSEEGLTAENPGLSSDLSHSTGHNSSQTSSSGLENNSSRLVKPLTAQDDLSVAQACSCLGLSGLAENSSLSGSNLAPVTCDSAETHLDSAVILQPSEQGSRSHIAVSKRLKTNQQHEPANMSSNPKLCTTHSSTRAPPPPAGSPQSQLPPYQEKERASSSPPPTHEKVSKNQAFGFCTLIFMSVGQN